MTTTTAVPHKIGLDWGSKSLGFAAVETSTDGAPVSLLSAQSYIHDGGVGPDGGKTQQTRLAKRGEARRARRRNAAYKKRISELDTYLTEHGLPLHPDDRNVSFEPWHARATLATTRISDPAERDRLLALAIRHIGHHRGARNPWIKLDVFLRAEYVPSAAMLDLTAAAREQDPELPEQPTQAVALTAFGPLEGLRARSTAPSRGEKNKKDRKELTSDDVKALEKKHTAERLLGGRFMAADFLHELRVIADTQGMPFDEGSVLGGVARVIFAMGDPAKAAQERVGKDPLNPVLTRAAKHDEAFQSYRILGVLTNLRIAQHDGDGRSFTGDELTAAHDLLMTWEGESAPTWQDVADRVGVPSTALSGMNKLTLDGEPVSGGRAPHNTTHRSVMANESVPALVKKWWADADAMHREVFVAMFANTAISDDTAVADIEQVLSRLSVKQRDELDQKMKFESGRVAYSSDTCARLARRMLNEGVDTYTARTNEYGTPEGWEPPAPRIGEPTGNPAVDRVLSRVEKLLRATDAKYGPPTHINIEHVRDAFKSVAKTEEEKTAYEKAVKLREAFNEDLRKQVRAHLALPADAHVRHDQIVKARLLYRQNSQCAYCGAPVTFGSVEVDHIVARKSETGSNNREANLIGACQPCNSSKSNHTFTRWLATNPRGGKVTLDGVVDRIGRWNLDLTYTGPQDPAKPGKPRKSGPHTGLNDYQVQQQQFRDTVIARLNRKSDETPNERGFESGAWVARELSRRIKAHYARSGHTVQVDVFNGAITASARRAAGVEKELVMIGGHGKQRLDRRHHAVDAATIALMRRSVSTVLTEREQLRETARTTGQDTGWKTYVGGDNTGNRLNYEQWMQHMSALTVLLNDALRDDTIPVLRDLRLRTGARRAHEDTIRPLDKVDVTGAFTPDMIQRASSPQLWTALTRQPDYTPKTGLPADPDRRLTVNGVVHDAVTNTTLGLFPKGGALMVPVRGGYAEAGNAAHHARIYSYPSRGKITYAMVRMLESDLLNKTGLRKGEDPIHRALHPSMTSYRYADKGLQEALANGTATHHGDLYINDEVILSAREGANITKSAVHTVQKFYPQAVRWVVTGYYSMTQISIRPSLLAGEGLPDGFDEKVGKFISARLPHTVNALVEAWNVDVVRRDVLGEPITGRHGCWSI